MITTNPITITSGMIASSTVPYPDTGENVWSSAVTYASGATVSYSINGVFHRFESKQASNLNHIPQAFPDDKTNAWWIDLGYVNRLAAFQNDRNTQTITASPYVLEVDSNLRVGAIGLGNLAADSVVLEILDGATVVHTETRQLKTRAVYDWYSWLYEPFYQVTGTVLTHFPINSTHTFKLTFADGSGTVKVGSIIAGVPSDIGTAQYGTGIRRQNFSTFERDEFGETRITVRRNIPRVNFNLIVDKPRLNNVVRLLDDLNGVVTFYAGIVETNDGYFDSVFLIGLYKDVSYSLDMPNHARAQIEIEAI